MPLRPRRLPLALFPFALTALTATACAPPSVIATLSSPLTSPDSVRIQVMADEQAGRVPLPGRGVVGVPPFSAVGTDSALAPLAFALADLIAGDLAQSPKVRIVERNRLADVIKELDLARDGRLDAATAPRVGKLVRADRLIFGSLQGMNDGKTLRIGARVGDVERAVVTTALDATAPLAEILAAEKAVVFRLFDALGVALSPAERALIQAQPTRELSALLAYGRGVQRTYEGDFTAAAREFKAAAAADGGFKQARARQAEVQSVSGPSTETPVAIPGVRPLGGVVAAAVDNINAPLPSTTSTSRTKSSAADPSFPTTQATVVIIISRP
ncbi:MAG: CsgG/HfaB family protein [Gemmatimonadaceae bacterium]